MQHQRKFLSPRAAISAAAVAVHPFAIGVAEIVSIRHENGTWGAILRLYDDPASLPRRAVERLAPFQVEQVAEPEPDPDDDWSEAEDEERVLELLYHKADGSLKHGSIATFISRFFGDNTEATTKDCISAGEAAGFPKQQIKNGIIAYRMKMRMQGILPPSGLVLQEKVNPPSDGWPSVEQIEHELRANPAVAKTGLVNICRTAYPHISHYPRLLQVQVLTQFGVAAMTARTQMARLDRTAQRA